LALDELYKEVILDHYKNPRNKREMPDAELSCSKNNPLCGDEITVFVHEDDGKVLDVSFLGQGCSISQSSASMMTEAAAGKTRAEVEERIGAFRGMMAGEIEADEDAFGELVALKGVVKYPVRVKCAVLAWDVLQEALAGGGPAVGSAPHKRGRNARNPTAPTGRSSWTSARGNSRTRAGRALENLRPGPSVGITTGSSVAESGAIIPGDDYET
jgi:nitrogen fixation NifU-like protein